MNKEKLRYAILKEVDSSNLPITEKDFDVSGNEFDEAVNFLSRENYLTGVFYSDDRPHLYNNIVLLSEKGELYLKENTTFSKTYKGLKEIREWFRL